MRESEVHLVVVGFVYGCEVLGDFLHEWYQDETKKEVADVAFTDEIDFLDEEDGHEGDEGQRHQHRDNALGECEFWFREVFVPVVIAFFVGFENVFVEAVVRSTLEPDVYAEGDEEDDGGCAGDAEGFGFGLFVSATGTARDGLVEDCWDYETNWGMLEGCAKRCGGDGGDEVVVAYLPRRA